MIDENYEAAIQILTSTETILKNSSFILECLVHISNGNAKGKSEEEQCVPATGSMEGFYLGPGTNPLSSLLLIQIKQLYL
jgi:hypothetical protein